MGSIMLPEWHFFFLSLISGSRALSDTPLVFIGQPAANNFEILNVNFKGSVPCPDNAGIHGLHPARLF